MPDVQLVHTPDGGEISSTHASPELRPGLQSAVYISLFGGNERDSGETATDALQYWANFAEPVPERRIRSATQHLLRSLPAIPANLRRIEDAVMSDLAWLIADGANVAARATMPGLNRIRIMVVVEIDGKNQSLDFPEDWRAAA